MILKATSVVFIAVALISCASKQNLPDQETDNGFGAIQNFATALLSADTEKAKLLSTPDQWIKIDEWIKEHSPVLCRAEGENTSYLAAPDLSGGSWFISGSLDNESGKRFIDLVYECRIKSLNYCFEMNGARLENINDEWRITGWETMCETNDDSVLCSNMCE